MRPQTLNKKKIELILKTKDLAISDPENKGLTGLILKIKNLAGVSLKTKDLIPESSVQESGTRKTTGAAFDCAFCEF